MSLISDKSALVTGASGAIGRAICEELLKNGIKYLAVLDMNSQEPKILSDWKKTYPSVSIKYFQVDVTSREELEKCYSEFTKAVPSLDIVINCAGIFNEKDPTRVINVNLNGVIESTRIAIDHMRIDTGKGKGGTIINISSVAGLSIYSAGPAYCASKFGVVAYTRALAHGRDHLGIKFLVLCPHGTDSELYERVFSTEYCFMTSEKTASTGKKLSPAQSPSEVGKAAVEMMQNAKSGSVWTIITGKLTEAELPPIRI
ncbi:alcohol dehydrogenase 1-like [Phlebotomus papatasi]|uniref:alcohol dehydrogenase 1-like n=1 Tax=Phlebotomus papatasi TaxID=29031 RepID=UPI002483F449|nr:alcohol dehydrogenase 1-like [Phlebotomus papatasi]